MSVFEEKNKHTTMCGLPRWAKSKEAEKINIVAEKYLDIHIMYSSTLNQQYKFDIGSVEDRST